MIRAAWVKLWAFSLLLSLGRLAAQIAPVGGGPNQAPASQPAQTPSNPCPTATSQPTPSSTPATPPASSPSPAAQSTNSGQQPSAAPSVAVTLTSSAPSSSGGPPATPKIPPGADVYPKTLSSGNNASDIAKMLTGTPGVISVVAKTDTALVFILTDASQEQSIGKYVDALAASKPAGSASPSSPSSSPSKPTSGEIFLPEKELGPGSANAADIAAALASLPGVISATALTDRKLVFILDTTPKADGQDNSKLKQQINDNIEKMASARPSTSLRPSVAAIPYAPRLPTDTANTPDIAAKLAGAIPGVLSITPIGNSRILFLLDNTPDPKSPNKPRAIKGLEDKIDQIVQQLALPSPRIYIPPFPLANGKNCDIMNALTKQIPGVLNISPVGNAYLAFYIDRQGDVSETIKTVDALVSALAEPVTVPQSPETDIFAQRLYYNHDPTSVAAVIDAAFPDVKASPILPDTVLLSTTLGSLGRGKRDPLQDARRAIATIDQPKPQVSLQTWSIQVSADRRDAIKGVEPKIREIAKRYNDIIGISVQAGWQFLVKRLSDPDFLDQDFSSYLTQQSYARRGPEWRDAETWRDEDQRQSQENDCCYRGNNIYATSPVLLLAPPSVSQPLFTLPPTRYGYALGYTTLFHPLTPNLIYMLVALGASTHPKQNAIDLINVIETDNPAPALNPVGNDPSCQVRDQNGYEGRPVASQRLELECARDALTGHLFATNAFTSVSNTSDLGRFRAAVADFLFQYKMMVEYPNDFHSYLAAEAAANLDSQLNPIVRAFNSDLEVFQERMRDEIENPDLLKEDHITYASSGIVSVKVVAGTQASVQTNTLNYFDATPTPTLADLAAAIKSIGTPSAPPQQSNNTSSSGSGGKQTGSSQPLLPTILTSNISANEAVAALAAVQALTRTPVSAKIGKGLTLTATAYSLSGAAGAEMDISVESNENGAQLISAATAINSNSQIVQTDDLASRVSDHKVTTRVRVDSMNLFELSTMEAVLARGKTPWKPVDPVLEIPLLSELIRIPRKPALTYHRSFIFINALIVPTAADLGNGLPLQEDVWIEPGDPPVLHRAKSLKDLGIPSADQIWPYHQAVVNWLSHQYVDTNGVVQSGIPQPLFSQVLPLH